MFDIGWTEILVIAIVAIVVIGPKDLPRAMRFVGQWTGKMKRMAREFQGQFNEALKEAELDTVKSDIERVTKTIDPIGTVRRELTDISASLKKPVAVPSNPPAASQPMTPITPPIVPVVAAPAASEPVVAAVTPAPPQEAAS